ncbi:MAG TPA: hypothetical protein VJO53_11555 [Candidatus Acidoferrales bacterium]|nr:hypothetical protein [Candidatus Acidoferrales bacterium]
MSSTNKWLALMIGLAAALFIGAVPQVRAQDAQGPMAPPPKFEVKRIPSVPHPGPPPIPQEEIIRRFAAAEDAAKKVFDTYSFTETIRLEELTDPGGKFTVTGEEYTRPDGQRYWRVVKQPESNLKLMNYSLEDVRTIVSLPRFFLTTDQIPNYDFLYAGQQKLDELNTYVFQVKPKTLSRAQRFFQGVIFVDDHDLAIVETYGKFVSELVDTGTKLPFSLFETYRENFHDKYWLPTYTSSDDYIDTAGADQIHLRLVVRATNFKLNSAPAAAPASAPSLSPAAQSPAPAPPIRELPQPR